MRGRSIIGPLLLMALGAVLLARNLYPDLPIGEYIANYWPYLLIFWGVMRLGEVVAWSTKGHPLPSHGVSGGEWFAIFFLILFGSGIHAARNFPRNFNVRVPWGDVDIFTEHYDYPVEATHAAAKAPQITIEDFRGDVTVKGDGENAVKLTGHKSIGAMNKESADESNGSSAFEITGDEANLIIRLREDRPRPQVRITGALELSVPKGASIRATRRSGDLHIRGVDGAVRVEGRGSDIDLEAINGPVSVDGAFAGTVRARNLTKQMSFNGRNTQFTVTQIPGELSVDAGDLTATDIVGPMSITSRSNDLRLTGFTNALDVTVQRGDLHLEPGKLPLGPMHVRSRSGDIQLILPEGAQFTMDASTGSGDISNSFGGGLQVEERGRRQTLKGAVGTGSAIEIETNRGDISISKGSVLSTPSTTADSVTGSVTKDGVTKNTVKKSVLEKVEQ
ncbi:MAG: DUF4097 family beta strand repeat-containing protein [Bryobacteraceae bacterium]